MIFTLKASNFIYMQAADLQFFPKSNFSILTPTLTLNQASSWPQVILPGSAASSSQYKVSLSASGHQQQWLANGRGNVWGRGMGRPLAMTGAIAAYI